MNSKIQLNDLFDYGYKIYQNNDYFKFSIDSVLLAEFINVKLTDKKILDLCTGNAPIPMILTKKYGSKIKITGIEIQKEIYEMGEKSIKFNNLNNIKLINDDVNNFKYINNSYDIICCNPPYFKVNEKNNLNLNEKKSIARHELKVKLEDIIKISNKYLKIGGYLYLVHRSERLAEIIELLHKYKFGLKRLVPIYNDDKSRCVFILIEAIYQGKDYVRIEKPIYLNHLSKTYQNIFRGGI